MSYLEPTEFVTKMVDSGESKVYMSTKDTLIRAFMAGAILGLAAVFAIMLFLIITAIVVTPYSKHTFVFRPFFNSPTIFSSLIRKPTRLRSHSDSLIINGNYRPRWERL